MRNDQRTFGRRVADISPAQRAARLVATWCGSAALVFVGLTTGAGIADKPGAVAVAFMAATCSLMVAIVANAEA